MSSAFPNLFAPDNLVWGPAIIAIATGYMLIKLWSKYTHKDTNKLIPYTLLFIFGILTIKAGSNRIDVSKMTQIVAPIYFVSFIILCLAIYTLHKRKEKRLDLIIPIIILILAYIPFAQFKPDKLLRQPNYTRAEVSRYVNMPKSPDNYWGDIKTQKISNYILKYTKKKIIFSFYLQIRQYII